MLAIAQAFMLLWGPIEFQNLIEIQNEAQRLKQRDYRMDGNYPSKAL